MTKIMVIEDDAVIRGLLVEMLTLENYAVSHTDNGLRGVQLAREVLPDVIICDIMMPGLDGYGVLTELRQHAATAAIPFIFLTAKADKADRREGMGLGADDYLTKPFTSDEVLGAIEARLKRRAVLTEQYEHKLQELRGSLSLSMPHELRTPLTGILTMSEVLLESFDVLHEDDIRDGLKSIHDSGQRLARLVLNYLTYAELEVALANPTRSSWPIDEDTPFTRSMVTSAALDRAGLAQRSNDLKFDLHDTAVRMAPAHLVKLVEELVDNACKFSPPGTPIEIGDQVSDELYQLTITDHGRGMTAEQIVNVGAYMQFERKLHEQQGSGLGLTIAKRLAEFHGGALSIDSVYGSYTTVRVSLPT
jgi:signal transduction histidine kinase